MKCLLFMVLFLPVVYSQSQVNSDRCGKGSLSCEFPTGRISGGKDTCSEMQPWHALIKFQRKSHLKCGGVLITEQHVLSAAHCYWSNGDNCPAKFHSFTLEQCRDDKHCPHYDCRRFGEHDILVYLGVTDSTELGYGEVRTLKKLDLHQGWVKETQLNGILQGNDLALLTLRSRVDTACTHIMPICLPLQPSVIGKMAYVVGFGLSSRLIQPTTRLQKAEVQIMECENRAGNKKWPISGNQLCALGEETDKTIIGDTCKGDSGGGLFCFDAVNNRNYLLGITSFGEDLCGITDSRPGVYTNVYDHKDWIEAMIKENGSDNKCALRSGPDMPPQEPVAVKTTVILLGGRVGKYLYLY
ncbi:serine protease 27 [Eurytemora carolleeae]|uniref:serine protease 27 n=1 Tax=Eurytemora carolleeae TaxID=1294199 RepID=UPI000C78B246|nr:serine protease 27 [Eurytemora carolleeae]|eukprot:XP_023340428.1 serine protease 27-like [Eurytemora affinis]